MAQQTANQFRRITTEWGLSNNQINTIFQDSQGFMWFATVSGLNRYDGFSFKIFKNIPGDSSSLPENSIQRIYEDYLGHLWLFTTNEIFFYDPALESFSRQHVLFTEHPGLSREDISVVRMSEDSMLWIGYSQSGLFRYNPATDSLQQFQSHTGGSKALSSNRITDIAFDSKGLVYAVNYSGVIDVIDPRRLLVRERIQPEFAWEMGDVLPDFHLFVDSDDDLWIYSFKNGGGVVFIDRQRDHQMLYSDTNGLLSNAVISGVIEDDQNQIWIGTDHGGVNLVNKANGKVSVLTNIPGDVTSLSGNSINSLFKSRDGLVWLGTFKNGINYYHRNLFQFALFRSQPHDEDKFFNNDVNCFAEDMYGNLWIGTNGEGLVYYNRRLGTFKHYRYSSDNPNSLCNDVVVSMCVDHRNRLWVGTYQGGLSCYEKGQFTTFRHQPDNPASLADNRIWQILEDRSGRLWIGTLGGGLDLYDESTGVFVHHRVGDFNSVSSNYILALLEDAYGNIWIGTSSGLNKLDINTQRFSLFDHDGNRESGLSNATVLSLCEDKRGRLWVGTRNGLNLFDRDALSFKVFREKDGLPDHNIISILDDEKGDLWISTLNGLSNLVTDSVTGQISFRNFDRLDGLQGLEFNEHSVLKTSRGELIFGGANGFNIFRPSQIEGNHDYYDVLLTDLRLLNKSVEIGHNIRAHQVLKKALNLTSEIALKHNQDVFSIEFAALNYFHPERTRFRYRLDGFNTDWIETDAANRTATYTNLNPGTYTFRVQASGSDGSWNVDETRLSVVVIPPFYATQWAYSLYFVLFVLLLVLLTYIIRRSEAVKFARQQEVQEHQRIHDLDNMKIRFFTNISHEFRTPLTLIITPLEKLIKETTDESLKQQLGLIMRNGKRLLTLVNQLLDFRKMEVQGITLKLSEGDVVVFVSEVASSFVDLFDSKLIEFKMVREIDSLEMCFDADKLEKVIVNLLSNAFKFSHEKGKVVLTIGLAEPTSVPGSAKFLRIVVKDEGIGISANMQERVFERFFQAGMDADGVAYQGSGIGLALAREFVRAHGGQIYLKSEEGKGSSFIVELPAQLKPDALINTSILAVQNDSTRMSPIQPLKHKIPKDDGPLLLIVEDNEDLRFYLKENLGQIYRIVEAANGADGYEKASTGLPDLIISDIMMTGIDGLELCRRLKRDAHTSHIPVILLTARVSTEQELEGLDAGADDYITKPFNYEVLALKIKKHLEIKEQVREKLRKKQFEIEPGEIGITSLDAKFIKRAISLVEKNMSNSDFTVEKFSLAMGVSRGHLYNKMVALTGKTPIEFIRIMRLKRAAQYLAKSQLSVSEIAFKVGFNDPKSFSRYFKEEYGVSPSVYIKKMS